MIDSHIHLHQYDPSTLSKDIEQWQEVGVTRVMAVANDLSSSYRTLELQQKFPNFVHALVGFHPELPQPPERDIEEWQRLISKEIKRITAIGEIGLPHYHLNEMETSFEQHLELFEFFLHTAKLHKLPVALHAVHDKAEVALSLVKKYSITNAHFHWLKAPEQVVDQIIQSGYFISVTPEICYRKRDQLLAASVPLSQLLIETDGPWPFESQFKAKETTPLFLINIIEQLSKIKSTSIDRVKSSTSSNTKRCYNIPT
ncbi:deoxyribonuclease [Halalkalibacter wakoensis JCM 9140]|uniref:Deoxyribonuclease n=1 Tax=Halalkalibacter wakoensis JCM 9140 TaxID=1236970 RepID=W4PYR8_9BACI|nr:TatD family hydrolase [Halalkalibacter wakoensis]GAE24877.1 deoxyribonuclease [Halalkalibacter wakoensis JCM 9140]